MTGSRRDRVRSSSAPSWKQGFRMTREQQLILDVLAEATEPLSAEDICRKVQERLQTVALSTVYRNLNELIRRGAVEPLVVGTDGRMLFEFMKERHRHYLVCVRCHRLVPIEPCPLTQYERKMSSGLNCEVIGHSLVFYGYCPQCRQAELRRPSGKPSAQLRGTGG